MVPDEAVPYLGSVLDPRLFDVSYLARAQLGIVRHGAAHGTAIPVTLSYPGAAPPHLPGLRVTRAGAGTAAGTFAPGQGARLARLLASHWRPGPARLPGIGRLSLAPPPGAPPLPASPFQAGQIPGTAGSARQHGLPFHQMTINVIGPDGKPGAVAIGLVQNVDNAGLDTVAGLLQGNTISFSLPAGTYSVAFTVLTPHAGTALGYDAALAAEPQVSLTANRTLTLDARAAVRYDATLTGAAAPAARFDALDYIRGSVTGGTVDPGTVGLLYLGLLSLSGDGFAATNMSATPSAPVTKGTLSFTALAGLSSTLYASSADPTYTFSFPTDGRIPSSLRYRVPVADLTAIHGTRYTSGSDACGGDYLTFVIAQPWLPGLGADGVGAVQYQVPAGSRTDFVYDSAPTLDSWELSSSASVGGLCQFLWSASPMRLRPGHRVSVDWGKGPLVPSPVAVPVTAIDPEAATTGTVCPACRQGDAADVTIASDGDSAQHYESLGFPFGQTSPSSGLRFYRNGSLAVTSDSICSVVLVGQGQGTCGMAPTGLVLPLLQAAASYRLDWTLAGTGPASVDTSWTFRSGPADPVVMRLPGQEECAPDPASGCSLLPLLFLRYDLPLNVTSQAVAGRPLTVAFTAGYQQGMPAASSVTASVAASFDGGTSWSDPVNARSLGGGWFAATITQPQLSATTGFASLRVTARDGAGNSVTQTIIDAYGLTS